MSRDAAKTAFFFMRARQNGFARFLLISLSC